MVCACRSTSWKPNSPVSHIRSCWNVSFHFYFPPSQLLSFTQCFPFLLYANLPFSFFSIVFHFLVTVLGPVFCTSCLHFFPLWIVLCLATCEMIRNIWWCDVWTTFLLVLTLGYSQSYVFSNMGELLGMSGKVGGVTLLWVLENSLCSIGVAEAHEIEAVLFSVSIQRMLVVMIK